MQSGERHMNFIAISGLSISNVCFCYMLWSCVESAKAMPRKKFLAVAGPEMQSCVGLKCWLGRSVLQEKKNQGKLLHYFPSTTSVLLEENILLYPNCEQTSKLLIHWKKNIEFQVIYWEIITVEVTGPVIPPPAKWRLGTGIIVQSGFFFFVEKFGTKFIVIQDKLCISRCIYL